MASTRAQALCLINPRPATIPPWKRQRERDDQQHGADDTDHRNRDPRVGFVGRTEADGAGDPAEHHDDDECDHQPEPPEHDVKRPEDRDVLRHVTWRRGRRRLRLLLLHPVRIRRWHQVALSVAAALQSSVTVAAKLVTVTTFVV